MTHYALIKNGVVVNTIVADADFISGIQSQYDACIQFEPGSYIGIGMLYDGTNFTINPDDDVQQTD